MDAKLDPIKIVPRPAISLDPTWRIQTYAKDGKKKMSHLHFVVYVVDDARSVRLELQYTLPNGANNEEYAGNVKSAIESPAKCTVRRSKIASSFFTTLGNRGIKRKTLYSFICRRGGVGEGRLSSEL